MSGQTLAILPVTISMIVSRSSLTLSSQPCFAVGVMAKPLHLAILLPLVVSTLRIASMSGVTSCPAMSANATGEPMKGTGLWGIVGESGQMCVPMTTSPGSGIAICPHVGEL